MQETKSKFSLDLNKPVKVRTMYASYFGREFVGTTKEFYELLDVKENFMKSNTIEERLKRLYELIVLMWGNSEGQMEYIQGVLEEDVEKINKVRKELFDVERAALLEFVSTKFNEGTLEENVIAVIIGSLNTDTLSDYINAKPWDIIHSFPVTEKEELYEYLDHLHHRIQDEVRDLNVQSLCNYIMDYLDFDDEPGDLKMIIRRFERILSKDSGNFMFDTSILRNIPSGQPWIDAINMYYATDGVKWLSSLRDIHEHIIEEHGYDKDYHAFRKALGRIYNIGGRKVLDISKHYENSTYNI